MRILFIGDIVGKLGADIVQMAVPALRRRDSIDLVIANAENCENGSGLAPSTYKRLIQAEIDCITMGDHIYRKKDIIATLESQTNILKPANYPPEAPGRTWTVITSATGKKVAIFSLIGRVFMKPVDCPFRTADRLLAEIPSDVKLKFCDFHSEPTRR